MVFLGKGAGSALCAHHVLIASHRDSVVSPSRPHQHNPIESHRRLLTPPQGQLMGRGDTRRG